MRTPADMWAEKVPPTPQEYEELLNTAERSKQLFYDTGKRLEAEAEEHYQGAIRELAELRHIVTFVNRKYVVTLKEAINGSINERV